MDALFQLFQCPPLITNQIAKNARTSNQVVGVTHYYALYLVADTSGSAIALSLTDLILNPSGRAVSNIQGWFSVLVV